MSLTKEATRRFSRLSVSEKLIVVNTLLFVLNRLLVFLFQLRPDFFVRWVELPGTISQFLTHPWTILSYSFFHGGFFHLFWNMLLLYFSGVLFLTLFSVRRFWLVYLGGAVAGGILFLLSYQVFPVFANSNTVLVGASAAIIAVLLFCCTYTPYREVHLIFFNVKLWHIGLFVVLWDLVQLPINNPGGHLAHIGGAVWGFACARRLRQGSVAQPLHHWWAMVKKWLSRTPKNHLKTVYPNKPGATKTTAKNTADRQRYLDTILDKISKSGYESLSKEDKDFLFKSGNE